MRGCAKNGCEARADATVALLYEPKEVVVGDLQHERDPNLLELCSPHADRLSPRTLLVRLLARGGAAPVALHRKGAPGGRPRPNGLTGAHPALSPPRIDTWGTPRGAVNRAS